MPIRYDKPDASDGADMWALAREAGTLDLNTPYYYLTFAGVFDDTCIVAKSDAGKVVGFIAGFRPPRQPDTLFVWQIATAPSYRGRGIAHKMLRDLLSRLAEDGVRYLNATVTPSNEASDRMFRSFAERTGAPCEESLFFPADYFPEGDHEEERLLRIGPFAAGALRENEGELVKTGGDGDGIA